jgi:DNA (cytosine-5)-methyltransferase 1
MKRSFRVAGLFAGIGGLELGLRQAGHRAAMLCEVWPPAMDVLRAHFPRVPLAADVRTLEVLPEGTDLVTAGFPCQDLSQAGRTAGIAGSRSSLVDHVFRLIDASPVEHVLLENVSFMLALDQGQAMAWLAEAFESRGYRWAYRTINTLAFLPQRRERVFILASRSGLDPAAVLFGGDAVPPEIATTLESHAHGFYWTEGIRGLGWAKDAVPTLKNGSTVGIPSPPAVLLPDGRLIKPDIRDAERLQGFPADWTLPAEAAHRASLRWTLVGNAVSVPVARWLGERLVDPADSVSLELAPLPLTGRWPRAACFDGINRHAVMIGDHPTWMPRPSLVDFLQHEGVPLSARATWGFYERTTRASLRFPPGFIDRLKAHYLRACAREGIAPKAFIDMPRKAA